MFRLNKVVRYTMLIPALAVPHLSTAQVCESPRMASAQEAVSALDHGEIKTAFCSRAAFQLIENLPPEQAVPILIKHLGFGRPVANEPNAHEDPYPAIDALVQVGPVAEPALIDFIARQEDNNSVLPRNALSALVLIRHGDVVPTIKLLRQRSAELAGTPASVRLEAVARYMLKTYCRGKRQWCEKRLRQPD